VSILQLPGLTQGTNIVKNKLGVSVQKFNGTWPDLSKLFEI